MLPLFIYLLFQRTKIRKEGYSRNHLSNSSFEITFQAAHGSFHRRSVHRSLLLSVCGILDRRRRLLETKPWKHHCYRYIDARYL